MGKPFKFIGLLITDKPHCISINQTNYIEQLEADYDVVVGNVTEPLKTYRSYKSEEMDCNMRVKSIIGALRLVADRTRPDVAFAVGYLSRFADFPSKLLMDDCIRVLRYLIKTKNKSLEYRRGNTFQLQAYCDASHISKLNQSPTMGVIIGLGEHWVQWSYKKIRATSGSSTESELIVMQAAFKDMEPLRQLVTHEVEIKISATLLCDNTSALAVVNNGNYRNTACLDYQLKNRLRLLRESGYTLKHVPTDSQPADILTKPLIGQQFESCLNLLFTNFK